MLAAVDSSASWRSVEVWHHLPLTAQSTLKQHVIWFVSRNILSRYAAMYPPADRVESGETDSATENLAMILGRHFDAIEVVIAKIGIEERGVILFRRRTVRDAPRT